MDERKDNRSVATLMSELVEETTTLIRQQLALAKAEANEKLHQVTGGVKFLVIGGAILIVSLFYILDAVVYGIANLLPEDYRLWLAALIVGVITGIAGVILLKKGGKQLQTTNLKPTRTTESVKRDAQTIRGQV